MTWLPNARRSSPGSRLGRMRANRARHGSTFLCGIRVVAGQVEGESGRWRFRTSAADELTVDDAITIQHGKCARLRLRLVSPDLKRGNRPHHVILSAIEVGSGAQVQVSLPAGEAIRFGIGL